MYEVIGISNYHQFDGIELEEKDFLKLLEVLNFGNFSYRADVLNNGKREVYSNQPK